MSQKSLKKNAIFSVLRSFASICFPIISFPYISRILNPEGIGKINFANSFVDYFIMFAGLGITSYAGREAAKIRENKTELNKLSKELVIINSISTIVSYLVLFILTFSVPKFSQYLLLITICSSKILFETLGLNWLFIAEEDYGYITIRSIIFQFLSLICMFIFVHTEQDLFIYAIITVISSVGSNIFNLFYARKYINIFEKTKIELKKHLSPIFVFFGVSIAGRIYASIDTLMLGFMSDDKAIGIYTAANKITFMVNSLLAAAVVVIMPKAANLFSQNKTSEYLALVNKSNEFSILLGIPATAGLFLLSEPLIYIFCGQSYSDAIIPMKILTLLVLFSAITNSIYNNILIPQKKERTIFVAKIVAIALNFIFNLILIPKLFVTGACIATIISEFISNLILFNSSRHVFTYKKLITYFSKYFLLSVPMILLVGLCVYFIKNMILTIVVSIIIGVLSYCFILKITKNSFYISIKTTLLNKIKHIN